MRRIVLLFGLLALPSALLAQTPARSPSIGGMSVQFSWSGTEPCSPRSPAFTVSNAPPGTATLDFQMIDLNVPSFRHGGGRVAYGGAGSVNIPQGAFTYTGPCPPGQTHNYQWTVTALSAAGGALGTATATQPFPPR